MGSPAEAHWQGCRLLRKRARRAPVAPGPRLTQPGVSSRPFAPVRKSHRRRLWRATVGHSVDDYVFAVCSYTPLNSNLMFCQVFLGWRIKGHLYRKPHDNDSPRTAHFCHGGSGGPPFAPRQRSGRICAISYLLDARRHDAKTRRNREDLRVSPDSVAVVRERHWGYGRREYPL